MNTIDLKILPSPETNDHETRVVVDDTDWLGENFLGLDPPEFFKQDWGNSSGDLLVGRCSCGVVGCDDLSVSVLATESTVTWTSHAYDRPSVSFDLASYVTTIERQRNDFSWENLDRRVERFVGEACLNFRLADGMKFDWASARIQAGTIHLSFSNGARQRMLEFGWDGRTVESAVLRARQLKCELSI